MEYIIKHEPLISETKRAQVTTLVNSKCCPSLLILLELKEKAMSIEHSRFRPFRTLEAHVLPLTNCAFNKSGDRYVVFIITHYLASLQVAMIGHVGYGIQTQEESYYLFKGIKTLFMQSLSTILLEIRSSQALSIRRVNFGTLRQENVTIHWKDIAQKSFVSHLTLNQA